MKNNNHNSPTPGTAHALPPRVRRIPRIGVNRRQAMAIVGRQLAARLMQEGHVEDGRLAPNHGFYGDDRLACWIVHIPDGDLRVGASRVACVDKRTGAIRFDGCVGE